MKAKISFVMAIITAIILCATTACSQSKSEEPEVNASITIEQNTTEQTTTLTETTEQKTTESVTSKTDDELFREYVESSNFKNYSSRHKNMLCSNSYYNYDGELIINCPWYYDNDIILCEYEDNIVMLETRDIILLKYLGEESPYYVKCLFEVPDYYEEAFEYTIEDNFVSFPERETIVETNKSDEGVYTFVTEVNGQENIKNEIELFGLADCEYEEGMSFRYIYKFNADTKELVGFDAVVIDSDNKSHTLVTEKIEYDVNTFDTKSESALFDDYFEALADNEHMRTVTIIIDANTDEEHEVEYKLPYNVRFSVFRSDFAFAGNVYADRECTQVFEDSDGTQDIKIYIPKVDKETEEKST